MKTITTLIPLVLIFISIDAGAQSYWQADTSGTYIYNTNPGSVGIGTATPDSAYKLSVLGKIRAKEIKVQADWADFVFAPDYELMPLADLAAFVTGHKHLPGIPSESEVAERGVPIGEMHAKLLQKIEELTLYVIELDKEGKALESKLKRANLNGEH